MIKSIRISYPHFDGMVDSEVTLLSEGADAVPGVKPQTGWTLEEELLRAGRLFELLTVCVGDHRVCVTILLTR